MNQVNNVWMLIAAGSTFLASILHILVIVGGPDWYRFFGAGEQMAVLAERGHWYPLVVTSFISLVLAVWGLFALSASGVIAPLPLYKWALGAITCVFLLRGLCLIPAFRFVQGLSDVFWLWSSLITLFIGSVYFIGMLKLLSVGSTNSKFLSE